MSQRRELLKEKLKEFPVQSGVYLMKSIQDKILYVGKAKNLRNRVRNYFQDSAGHSQKTKLLVQNIHEIEY
ncbi:MAG: GIY-YIG nuclease family protein, partial [Pseudobdellovibrionaceae bacterium]